MRNTIAEAQAHDGLASDPSFAAVVILTSCQLPDMLSLIEPFGSK